MAGRSTGGAGSLAVVIPTLDAADHLSQTLASLAPLGAAETIVVDGGSADRTPLIAADHGARVITSGRGRGQQLMAGAAAARADWLLFHHADTRLDAGGCAAVLAYVSRGEASEGQAAYFRFRLGDASPYARWVEAWVALRCRLFALPFGDQSLLIARTLYGRIGGYRPLPLMEDVDLVERLGRRRLHCLPAAAVTSAERYRRDGYLSRGLRNLLCFALYRAGVPSARLTAFYSGRGRTT